MNKIRYLFPGLCMLFALLLFGCGEGEKNADKASAKAQESEASAVDLPEDAKTIRVFDKNMSGVSFDDAVAKQIMEKTGVRIEIMDATDDPEGKLEQMLGDKSYPDVILMEQGELVNRYIEAGAFIALDDLIERDGPDIKDMYGEILNRSEYTDGKLYWLANWYGADYDASAGVLMRRDLLSEIVGSKRANSSEPFTLSEYTEILRQFKEKYPLLEGQKSVALELDSDSENYLPSLLGMFGMKTYLVDEEDNCHYNPTTDSYKEALLYLNSLYREGLLDKEWVINKNERWEEKLSGGYVFSVWCSYWDTDTVNQKLLEKYGKSNGFYCYKVVADDLSADQTTYNGRNSLGWDAIGITENCEEPEAAMKVLNYLASEEGQYLLLWGVEGETWDNTGGLHTPRESFLESWREDDEKTSEETGARRWKWMIKNGSGTDGTPYDLTSKYVPKETVTFANKSIADTDYWDTALFSGLEPTANSALGLKWEQILELYKKQSARIICAADEKEAETLYGRMLEDMELLGLSECEAYITEQYKERLSKWNK